MSFLTNNTFAQSDCIISCDDQKNISIGTEGFAIIFPELVLNGNFDCAKPLSVDVLDNTGFSLGDTVRCEQVDKTLRVKVKGANGESCWSSIVVEDKLATSIRCTDLFIPCTSSINPKDIGYPELHDNCGSTDKNNLNYFDLFTELPCNALQEGRAVNARITRSWTIIDQHGNLGVCTQNIYLLKAFVNNIVFPGDCDGVERPILNCATDPDDLTFSGAPTINGMPVENADLCKFFVSYQDQTSPICPPASYRTLRRWEVIDLCSKEVAVHIQDIISTDNTPPELICPESFTLSANAINCTASVILPRAEAFDSCSNVVVQPTWEFGSGYGPFTDVPGGTHIITYMATDECGNTAVCTTELTVVDNTEPVAVCKELVHVGLNNSGTAIIDATIFDGGSKDNCQITKMEAAKDNIFDELITFDCSDLGKALPVVLRVYDAVGLQNECRSQVVLDDEILPIVVCPATVTIDCQEDATDLVLTGEATATDLCGIQDLYYVDGVDFNSCGTSGTIVRQWFAEDKTNNLGTCTQLILVVDKTPLEIIFPEEFTTNECDADLSPEAIGKPIISGEDCESILVSHEDEIIILGDFTCRQILRTWKVIDWCNFNGVDAANGGFISHTQIINIFDRTSPEITFCPPDISVSINTFDCETRVELPLLLASDCNQLLTYSNDSPYAIIQKEDASGNYPQGTTTVTYTVSDGCGNSNSCSTNITVIDEQAPTPVCKHSISIALRADGEVIVPHNAINSGSYDNCGTAEFLTYEITPNEFSCEDLGQQTINLIVSDAAGNTDFCTTDIFIQDNHGTCDPNSFSAIGGQIFSENGTAMGEVPVEISGAMSQMSFTNETGTYLFEDLSKLEDYTVRPMDNSNFLEGISTFDVVLITKHILDKQSLDSPYKLIAADINKSGSISTYDIVLLRRVILGVADDFPNNQSWRYVAAEYEFPDKTNPFKEEFPEHINYKQLLGSEFNKDFIAVKIGDVNDSANPSFTQSEARTTASFLLHLEDIEMKAGQTYRLPVLAKDLQEILGYQMTLQFDQSLVAFQEVIPNQPNRMSLANFGLNRTKKGFLTTSWEQSPSISVEDDALLFTLVIKAKKNTQLSKTLVVNSSITIAEAYSKESTIMDVGLHFTATTSKSNLALFQNQPNPFTQQTIIGFQLPSATTATLSIYNINGQLVKTFSGYYQAGYNELLIDLKDLTTNSGVLYYHLQTPNTKRLTKKMIRLK